MDFEVLTAEAESLVEPFRQVLPGGLEEMSPGPFLAAVLSWVDRSRLNGHDLVRVMRAETRMASHYEAARMATMVEVAQCPAGDARSLVERDPGVEEFAADEIRVALRLTRRSAEYELGFAFDLKERLPQVWEALHVGRIDMRRAKEIAHGTSHLPVGTARDVVDRVIGSAPGLTTGQLRARMQRLCLEADPAEARKRYGEALEERRVVSEPNVDGTANLMGLQLPPHRVAAIRRRVNRIAKGLKHGGDQRTVDQIRADIYLDLLQGKSVSSTGPARGVVDLQADLKTLAGLADKAGEIPGYGPVIADIARQVAKDQHDAEWRATITDPNTGQVMWTGTTRRRPTARQTREVQARLPSCVFPGCRMPATECDLDHTQAWAGGGPTTTDNLAPLCRHDHRVKHQAGWKLQRQPNGQHVWTSRLGHTYITPGDRPP